MHRAIEFHWYTSMYVTIDTIYDVTYTRPGKLERLFLISLLLYLDVGGQSLFNIYSSACKLVSCGLTYFYKGQVRTVDLCCLVSTL